MSSINTGKKKPRKLKKRKYFYRNLERNEISINKKKIKQIY